MLARLAANRLAGIRQSVRQVFISLSISLSFIVQFISLISVYVSYRLRDASQLPSTMWVHGCFASNFLISQLNKRLFFLLSSWIWIFNVLQHVDSPDNNPDLTWEFSETNKKKVGVFNDSRNFRISGVFSLRRECFNLYWFRNLGNLDAFQIDIRRHLACLMTIYFSKQMIVLLIWPNIWKGRIDDLLQFVAYT